MADGTESRVNLAALRRVDPYATEILETGTQVAVYKFNSELNQWEKTDVVGTLFLYNRSGDPCHGFVVMNRLSTENFVEPITKDMEIQLQTPFLLYKNAKGGITGLWFYEENECKRLAQHLEAFIKQETARHQQPQPTREPSSGVDILTLLSRAQGEFERKCGKTGGSVVKPGEAAHHERSNGLTSSAPFSVADLFGNDVGKAPSENLSHGASTLDKLLSSVVPSQALPPSAELQTAHNLERELREKLKIGTPPVTEKFATHSTPLAKPVSVSGAINIHRQTPTSDHVQAMPFTPAKPGSSLPLMSPMMFATAAEETNLLSDSLSNNFVKTFPVTSEEAVGAPEVTPLTKAQLIQAFNYLLKSDPGFITRLHEAYVESLKQSLKMGQ